MLNSLSNTVLHLEKLWTKCRRAGPTTPTLLPFIRLQTSRSCSVTVESLSVKEYCPSSWKLMDSALFNTQLISSSWNRQKALKAFRTNIPALWPGFILFPHLLLWLLLLLKPGHQLDRHASHFLLQFFFSNEQKSK